MNSPEAQSTIPPARKSGRVRKICLTILGLLCVLAFAAAGAIFYLSTDSGLRKVILPIVSGKIGMELAADSISLGRTHLEVQNLRIGPLENPLAKIRSARTTFSLRRFLKGEYVLKTLLLDTPSFHYAFPPATESEPQPMGEGGTAEPSKTSSLPSFHIRNLQIINLDATVRRQAENFELTQLSLKASDITREWLPTDFEAQGLIRFRSGANPTGEPSGLLARLQTAGGETSKISRFEIKAGGLDLGRLVGIFKPALREKASGFGSLNTYGTCSPGINASLPDTIDGAIEVNLNDAHLEKLPGIASALQKLAFLLQSPAVAESSVSEVKGSAKIHQGRLTTDNFHVIGSFLQCTLRGDVQFGGQCNLEALIKLNRDAINQSALLLPILSITASQQEEWFRIPEGAQVSGPVWDPEVKLDTSKIANKTLQNIGGNFLKGLLAPTPKTSETGTNSNPPPSDPVSSLIDVIRPGSTNTSPADPSAPSGEDKKKSILNDALKLIDKARE
jgi:hypothetical protein